MNLKVLAGLSLALALFAGVLIGRALPRDLPPAPAAPPAAAQPQARPVQPVRYARAVVPADSPSRGNPLAKVTLVQWSDFQCPFCARSAPLLHQLEEVYGDELRIVFRHQPLTSIHPQALLAAEASMAAHEQGKFWPMHDLLYQNGRTLDRARIEALAEQLGLDLPRFRAAIDSGKYRQKIADDAREGVALGASATPSFFINGRLQVGGGTVEQFRAMIDQERARADALLAAGVPRDALYATLLDRNTTAAQQR